jgi:predicted NBD/HSP70 family sugar kinase
MTEKRFNSNLIRRINVVRVFHGIRAEPGISPQRLSKATGLDLATISIIINGLEQDLVVRREIGARTGRSGRPTSNLYINADAGVLAGVSFEADKILLVITTLTGVQRGAVQIEGSTDAAVAVAAAKSGLLNLLKQTGIKRKALVGVGVGVPGLVALDGRLVLAPNLGWQDFDLAGALTRALGGAVPVQVENDTKAAALAEHVFGSSRDVTDFVYLTGRSGVGAGLHLGGNLYRGPHGLAGEIGHMKLVPFGRPCNCGAFGCFEAYVSERAILTSLAALGRRYDSAESMRLAAETGDPLVRRVLDETGAHLGLGLSTLANLLAPQRIILGGSLATLASFLLPAAQAAYAANALEVIRQNVEIVISPLGAYAIPLGGTALALQHFLAEPSAQIIKMSGALKL